MAFGVTCPTCGKAFSITDEIYQRKVSGRVVTIKCKQCQAGIRVDASKPGVTKISAAAKEAVADKAIETKSVGPLPPQAVAPAMGPQAAHAPRMRQATLIGGVANTLGKQAQAAAAALRQAPPSPPPPPAPPPPPETLWAVEVGDGQDREMSLGDLGREIEGGTIPTTALAWREGMAEWLEIRQVPDLAGFVRRASQPKAAPAPAPLAAPPPPAPAPMPAVKAPQAPRIAEAPMSEEAPTQPKGPAMPAPRAPIGSGPRLPPPPPRTSAPEFPAPSPQAPPAAPPPVIAAPPALSPFEPAPAPPAPTPFQLAPSAIDTSPVPPFAAAPAPVRPVVPTFATPGPVAASTDFEMPKVRSKAPLFIGAVALIGAVVAAVVLLNGSETQPVPLTPAAESPPIATVTPTSASTSTTAANTAAPTAAADEGSPGSGSQTTPGSGFAEAFASGARVAEGDGSVAPRFDPAVAKKAVAKVLSGVGRCKEPGGPRGVVSASIAFDPSGKVSTVTISDAPFAGTSTASCLSSVLKQASMPPFKGLPSSLEQPISVR